MGPGYMHRVVIGTIAEKTLVRRGTYVVLPQGLDNINAAALPNAIYGSAMALLFRAGMKKDEVVLINGATSVTGQLAVEAARLLSVHPK